jgi:hypothetical protein
MRCMRSAVAARSRSRSAACRSSEAGYMKVAETVAATAVVEAQAAATHTCFAAVEVVEVGSPAEAMRSV